MPGLWGNTYGISIVPTVTAGAYAAGNEVGGLLTFYVGTGGVLQSIHIDINSVQTATFKLYLFGRNPSNTVWTDKSTPSVNALDAPHLAGVYTLSTADSGLGTHSVYNLDGIGKALSSVDGNVYGVLVTTGTPTFASTTDVKVALAYLKD